MEFTVLSSIWIVFLGLLVGLVSGFFGIGGGVLLTPLLSVSLGISYPVAVVTSLTQMVGTSSTACIPHFKQKNINFKSGIIIIVSKTIGLLFGFMTLEYLQSFGDTIIFGHKTPVINIILDLVFICMLTFLGIKMMRSYKNSKNEIQNNIEQAKFQIPVFKLLAISFLVGIISGILGIGGGVLMIPALHGLLHFPMHLAIGTNLLTIPTSNAIALLVKDNGTIIWNLIFLVLAGSIVGSLIGGYLTKKFDSNKLKKYFAIVLMILPLLLIIGRIIKYSK